MIEETPLLIIETPAVHPFTRSRGAAAEYEHIMSIPLEWKQKINLDQYFPLIHLVSILSHLIRNNTH